MAVDLVAVLVRSLLEDSGISAAVGGRVFGGEIPEGAATPLILVRAVNSRPATRPITQWWTDVAAVDVHAERPALSRSLAVSVVSVIDAIEGTQPEGVVQACDATSITPIEDGGYTPTRHRNVVTVEATARNN